RALGHPQTYLLRHRILLPAFTAYYRAGARIHVEPRFMPCSTLITSISNPLRNTGARCAVMQRNGETLPFARMHSAEKYHAFRTFQSDPLSAHHGGVAGDP